MNIEKIINIIVPVLLFFCTVPLTAQSELPDIEDLRRWNTHMMYAKDLSDEELLEIAQSDYICYIVPHTHWDREWGRSYEQHRIDLLNIMDNVLTILEENKEYRRFVLDGQSSIITDYLKLRPENVSRVKKLAQQGRLLIGPWYTQPDMLVSSGEEMIRNLLLGIRTARDAGGVMMFGHTADNFGYCAQLPQIYSGFGIKGASLYRGPDSSADYYKNVFKWQSPDGSSVYVANLMGPSGYLMFTWPFNVPELPEALLLRALPYYTPYLLTNHLLLPAGSDALEPGEDLPVVLKRLENTFPNMDFHVASFSEYLDQVLAQNPDVPSYAGPLRKDHACTGSISARLDLKRQNAKAYTNLENFAEPVSTLAWLTAGRRYPAEALERSWKYLFENLTHDDMAGYSIDPVQKINETRFFEANRLAETLVIRGLKTLVEKIRTPDKSDILNKPIVVFNTLPWKRSAVAETWFSVTARGRRTDLFHEGNYQSYIVRDLDGQLCPSNIVKQYGDVFRICFIAENVPAFGYKTFQLVAIKKKPEVFKPKADVKVIENKLIKLTFLEDGRFDLLDKETGIEYPGLHYFEDQETAGGNPLYFSFSSNPLSTIGNKAKLLLYEANAVNTTMRIQWPDWRVPASPGAEEMVSMPVTSYITITGDNKRVDIYTEIENNSQNHMVRAIFPIPVKVDSFYSGAQFGVQTSPVWYPQNAPDGPWSHEIYPHLDWCDVSDGKQGLAVYDRGTPAISVYPVIEKTGKIRRTGTKILLPLFRACPSNSGDIRPSIPTHRLSSEKEAVSAQMFGQQRIYYSIFPHTGNWREANIQGKALNTATRLWPETLTINDYAKWQIGPYGFEQSFSYPEGTMPTEQSFLSLKPEDVLLSAFKKAEKGDAVILRFYNSSGLPVTAKFDYFSRVRNATAVNFMEEDSAGLLKINYETSPEGRTLGTVKLGPFQIITVRMDLTPPIEHTWKHTLY